MTNSLNLVRRARPLLGTIVEVGIYSEDSLEARELIGKAFSAVERIQTRMSRFEPDSEVSRFNRSNVDDITAVSQELYEVIEFGLELSNLSGGVFSVSHGSSEVVRMIGPHFLKRVAVGDIDLGGIAKGYAVDCAIQAMRQERVASGYVNAGGDIRCFGKPYPILVRNPKRLSESIASLDLLDAAFATSGNYDLSEGEEQSGVVVNKVGEQSIPLGYSASIMALDCVTADALTKCLLIMKDSCSPLLKRYEARGFIADGVKVTGYPNN